jgi:hypothetical protein
MTAFVASQEPRWRSGPFDVDDIERMTWSGPFDVDDIERTRCGGTFDEAFHRTRHAEWFLR